MSKIPSHLRSKIVDVWKSVLGDARSSASQFELFDSNVEVFVRETTLRLAYDRSVRFGDDRSVYFVGRFRRVLEICKSIETVKETVKDDDEGLDSVECDRDEQHAKEYEFLFRTMLNRYRETKGYSYTLIKNKYATAKKGKSGGLIEFWRNAAWSLRRKRKHDLAWAFEQLAAGEPALIADFKLKPLYMLVREVARVNEYIRVVELENTHGKRSGLLEMVADDFVAPQHFRRFALKSGPFTFGIGERAGIIDLNQIQQDVNKLLHGKEVYEQNEFGWREVPQSKAEEAPKPEGDYSGVYAKSGLWFFGDAVFSPMGDILIPSRNGVVKWDGRSYMLGKRGHDSQSFVVDVPFMQVSMKYQDAEFEIMEQGRFSGQGSSDKEVASALFQELYRRLYDTLGGANAGYVLGMVLAYAGAPEIFDKRGEFPGLWLHGKASSGKTHIGQWLMEIWGFRNIKPLELKGGMVTAVGLNNALSQVSNLPVFCDEFKEGQIDENKLSVVHNAYNRAKGAKWASPGMERREPKTSLIVAGETTSSNPAARGRYAHAPVSANLRVKNHWDWFLETAKYFCLIGRYILTHRSQFVDEQTRQLESWMETLKSTIADERQRFVYGTGYSSFMAAADLFESHFENEVEEVKTATTEASHSGAADVEGDIEVNRFWQDVCDLYSRELIGREFFKFRTYYIAHAPGRPNQKDWKSVVMFFQPGPLIAIVDEMRRKAGHSNTLGRKDLHSQMKTEEYWVGNRLRQRFGESKRVVACWGIHLDCHPLGYQQIDDDVWRAEVNQIKPCSDSDPRCSGELYSLYFGNEEEIDDRVENDG